MEDEEKIHAQARGESTAKASAQANIDEYDMFVHGPRAQNKLDNRA